MYEPMNKGKLAAMALMALAAFSLSSCMLLNARQTIGRADVYKEAHRTYIVSVPNGYNEQERIYAISYFVQFMSYVSYDAVMTRKPFFLGKDYYQYKVTVPGSTRIIAAPEEIIKKLHLDYWYTIEAEDMERWR